VPDPVRLLMIAALVCLSTAAPLFAQNAGSLRGTVTDGTGSTVPGATVRLSNEATKFTREAQTDANGGYFFAAVEPGAYQLKVELAGFKTYEASSVRVSPNATVGVDVVLQVGQQTETITVRAQLELIQTRTGAREGLITSEQIEKLSIVGRNPLELLRILPGVVAGDPTNNEQAGMFAGASGEMNINGARAQNLGVSLDGANLRDIGANSGTMNVPNNEFVTEIKVLSSNYAAEFGSSGVQVQAVTKSGSSVFHGTLYDYWRNYRFSANDRSRSLVGQEKPKSAYQYPGFTLSGPVTIPGLGFNKNRNKAFFFFGFETARQQVDEGTFLGITPTPGQRQGLFNDYQAGQSLNQAGTVNIPRGFPGAGTPAPNNDLRPYIDPIGQTLINLYPLPNYNDPNNRYNYVFNRLSEQNRNQFVLRADYNISEGTRTYVRLARDKDARERARGLWFSSSGVELPTPIDDTSLGRSAVLNVTSVLSPTATNEVIFTWSQLKNDNVWQDPSRVQRATYGLDNLTNPFASTPFIPNLVMRGDTARGSLWSNNDVDDIFSYNGFIRLGDSFTKVLNTHAIKLGFSAERQYKRQNLTNNANVRLNFGNGAPGTTGVDFGDLLTGILEGAELGTPSAVGEFVAWNVEGYAQDAWRLRRNLTLEYGLRFGKWTNNGEVNDLGALFLPERYNPNAGLFLDASKQRVNGLAYVRDGDVDRNLTDPRPLLFMPRVNVAWDLTGDGNTIVRGGGGLFYTREQGNAQYDIINIAPNAYSATFNASALSGLAGGRGLTYATLGQVDPFGALNGFNLSTASPTELDWPRIWNSSISVMRRLPWHQSVEVGYVGTFARHLAATRQTNVLPVGTLSSGTIGNADLSIPLNRAGLQSSVVNARRPFPTLQDVRYFEPIGRSNYHALQATLTRASGSFNYFVAYTLSKATGTVGNDFAPIDPLEPRRSDGVMPFDRRHILNVSWNWQLGDLGTSKVAKALGNGWNLSGISTFASGTPIRLGFGGDLSSDDMARAWWGTQDFGNFDRNGGIIGDITPTYACDPSRSGSAVGTKVLDISCLGIPAFGQTGPDATPYDLRSPSRMYHDLTVFKNFAIGRGDERLQFRAGFFNIFNQAYPDPGQNDVDLTLEANCNARVNHVPDGTGGFRDNVCDPLGGFTFTSNTQQNFGKVVTKRGHRVIEFALRFFF
jgi:hypothetical protein